MGHKVFRDAIHDMISLHRGGDQPMEEVEWGDPLLLDLIDAPEMQRLRRIQQLGLASRIYPSGEHSRFSHSLGVMHLAKRILAVLLRRRPGLLDREEILQVKVAALLHDLGHGPYSHVFEQALPGVGPHEGWTWKIAGDPDTGVNRAIRRFCADANLDAAAFFTGLQGLWGADGGEGGALKIGRQVISSQLDADRMDYLLRDAHFTGVSYGRYDLEWMLHSLRVAEVAGVPRLCLDVTRGSTALESYIAARDNMYRQVYDHKTVRAMELLLIHLFQTARALLGVGEALPGGAPEALTRALKAALGGEAVALADYLALDDAVVEVALGRWSGIEPQSPLQAELRWKSRLLRDRGPVYKRLFWREAGEGKHPSDMIRDADLASALDLFFREMEDEPISVAEPGGGVPREMPLNLLVFVDRLERAPYAHLQYAVGPKGGGDPVFVLDGSGIPAPAEEASRHINFLGHDRWRVARVFVDPRAEAAVKDLIRDRFTHPGFTLAG